MSLTFDKFLTELKEVTAKLKQVDVGEVLQKASTAVQVIEAVNSVTRNSTRVANATAKAKVVISVANTVTNNK